MPCVYYFIYKLNMKVIIDADACPVVNKAVKICKEYDIKVLLFCDTSHIIDVDGAETVTVSKGSNSADFAVVAKCLSGDIVITQDYGLAAMCLAKSAKVINQNGLIYSENNIDGLLFSRYTAKRARMAGQRIKGPKKRTQKQDDDFENNFRALILQCI